MSEAAAPAAAPAGGSNKMMFIMMGAMFVLLLGGMGGMYFMMKGSSAKEETAEHSEEGGKEGKEGEKGKGGPKAAAIYVGFEPPFVVNFPADSSVKFLQLTVQIMTREATVEHEIKGNDPAIRDALLNLFGQQTAEKLATAEGKEELRAHALEAVRNVIKNEGGEAEKVEAVYFTSFVMQ
ncbi:MAG: flagellar basal body-associated FliL family protein [Steroidobacteraceae bacterium]